MAEPPQREILTVRPIAVADLAARLRDLSPAVLAHLGHTADRLDWERTSRDTYETEWNGAKLGPSTDTRHRARPADGVEADVTESVNRWGPGDVANRRAGASWRVGDRRASCGGSGDRTDPVRELWTRGPLPLLRLFRDAFDEVPMDGGYLVRFVTTLGREREPQEQTARCPSEAAAAAFVETAGRQHWRTVLGVRRIGAPEAEEIDAAAWAAGARP